MTRLLVAITVVAALLAPLAWAPNAGAKCARVTLLPELLTHGRDVVPGGGGVLIGFTMSTDWEEEGTSGDPAFHAGWRFLLKKKKVRPKVVQLAPGLAVYRPGTIKGSKAVPLVLRDAKGKKVGSFKARRKGAAFRAPAPAVTAVTVTTSRGGRWGDDVTVTADLGGAVPADAVALIIYDASDVATSWANVRGSSLTQIVVYQSRNHCGGNPSNMSGAATGDQVTFAWVDQFGRSSPRSAAVTAQ